MGLITEIVKKLHAAAGGMADGRLGAIAQVSAGLAALDNIGEQKVRELDQLDGELEDARRQLAAANVALARVVTRVEDANGVLERVHQHLSKVHHIDLDAPDPEDFPPEPKKEPAVPVPSTLTIPAQKTPPAS